MSQIGEASAIITAQDQAPSFEQLRSCLDKVCNDIAIKYGLLTPAGRPKKAFVLDTLLKYSCRGCIRKVLLHPEANGDVDALYVQNHQLAVGLLVESLLQTFEVSGFNFKVAQEENGVFGRSDVVVKPNASSVLVELKDLEIVIEVKTGQFFSYSQIVRYWLERPKAIFIIWRIIRNQVLVIDPNMHHNILELCLLAAIRRGIDILHSKMEECTHTPACNIKCGDIDAQKILDSHFQMLQKALPKIVSLVYEIALGHLRKVAR
ncbi:MAG: hypothetical protein N3E52_04185 [Candidatus Bathyarchaeota archaeon]|nr:hypothetical protein [Candidatus Bathyarchaeota archaeon]